MRRYLLILFLIPFSIFGQMKTSSTGLTLIKHFEGFRSSAYRCPANVWTIGYGSTEGISSGMTITKLEAEKLLQRDLVRFENHVSKQTYRVLLWHEFDALTSFSFNVGYRIKDGLQEYVNTGNKNGVVMKLRLYNKARINGVLTVLKGLDRRRRSEATLYVDGKLVFYK